MTNVLGYWKVPTWSGPWLVPINQFLTVTTPTYSDLQKTTLCTPSYDWPWICPTCRQVSGWQQNLTLEPKCFWRFTLCCMIRQISTLEVFPHTDQDEGAAKWTNDVIQIILEKRPVALHKSICDPILPGSPRHHSRNINMAATTNQPMMKPKARSIFYQLGAPGNGPAGPEPDGSDVFFCLRPSDPQMPVPST